MQRIDTNGDGKIDYTEFAAKFKDNSLEGRMAQRAAVRMAKLKELMNLHMTSANDAFRYVSTILSLDLEFESTLKLGSFMFETALFLS